MVTGVGYQGRQFNETYGRGLSFGFGQLEGTRGRVRFNGRHVFIHAGTRVLISRPNARRVVTTVKRGGDNKVVVFCLRDYTERVGVCLDATTFMSLRRNFVTTTTTGGSFFRRVALGSLLFLCGHGANTRCRCRFFRGPFLHQPGPRFHWAQFYHHWARGQCLCGRVWTTEQFWARILTLAPATRATGPYHQNGG